MYLKTKILKLIFVITIGVTIFSCHETTSPLLVDATDSLANSKAIQENSAAIERDPQNAEAYYRRSMSYYNLKYLDRALIDIQDAIKYNEKNPLYQYQKGRICYAMNKTMDAEKAYLSAIALKPDYEEAQMRLGELYFIVKKHRASVDLLNSVTAKNPEKYDAYFFKGMNYKEMGDTGKAIAAFQKALEIDKDYYDAALQIGMLYTNIGNAYALEYLNTAIKMQRKNPEPYFARAYYYQKNRAYQKALFDYRKVIDLDPANDLAYYNVGCINYDVKQYKEALRSFDICIQMNNNNVNAYYMRGLIREIQGNKTDAKLNYEYALKVDPEYELAKSQLKSLK